MKLQYYVMDVFTRDRLAGNPLAVVPKADELSPTRMQALAREFNLSETVFLLTPKGERHAAALRIFTPTRELPFAGHPTIGAAVLIGFNSRASAVRLELGIGLVTAVMERVDKRTGHAKFALPQLPEKRADLPDTGAVAARLGLPKAAIGCGDFTPAQYSAGVPFYLVPVADAAALEAIALERRGWNETFPGDHNAVYAFTPTPNERRNDYAARMFAVGMGMDEDPATGSAAAALIGLLADQGGYGEGHHEARIRQGREMGRPSEIDIQFNVEDGQLRHAGIGGSAVVLAQGTIDLDE